MPAWGWLRLIRGPETRIGHEQVLGSEFPGHWYRNHRTSAVQQEHSISCLLSPLRYYTSASSVASQVLPACEPLPDGFHRRYYYACDTNHSQGLEASSF